VYLSLYKYAQNVVAKALKVGSGYPLYLFKAVLRGASNVAIFHITVQKANFSQKSFKKDAATIPNAPASQSHF